MSAGAHVQERRDHVTEVQTMTRLDKKEKIISLLNQLCSDSPGIDFNFN